MNRYYNCDSKSRVELRTLAKKLKEKYGYGNSLYFPIEKLLDKMALNEGFEYIVDEDEKFSKTEFAYTDVLSGVIHMRCSIYEGFCNGNGFCRMTVAHEIFHALSKKVYGIRLYRKFDYSAYNDPEWQAKCFAGELLMDYDLTRNLTASEIKRQCGVSISAANYRFYYIK